MTDVSPLHHKGPDSVLISKQKGGKIGHFNNWGFLWLLTRAFHVLLHSRIGAGHIICDMFLAYSFVVSQILVIFASIKGSRWCMPALYYPVWLWLEAQPLLLERRLAILIHCIPVHRFIIYSSYAVIWAIIHIRLLLPWCMGHIARLVVFLSVFP